MQVVCDIETNRLDNPDKIWCIVCEDVNSDNVYIFENVHENKEPFLEFSKNVSQWIGHYFLSFDVPVINTIIGSGTIDPKSVLDTVVVSRILNQDIDGGHSIEVWGSRLGLTKIGLDIDFSVWSPEILERCKRDVQINKKLYLKFLKFINHPDFIRAIETEHRIASLCLTLHNNGFPFKLEEAKILHQELSLKLKELDDELLKAFPPKARLVREITPRRTAFGTLHRGDFRWLNSTDLSCFSDDAPFGLIEWEEFNPGSPKQIVERLNEAGWKPTEKTKGHTNALRSRDTDSTKLEYFREFGWSVSEENLKTLPDTAPEAARKLVERLLIASRVSDLEEWINLTKESGRIHGRFNHIGAWTHRMSHDHPNMANTPIPQHKDNPSRLDTLSDSINTRMRTLWYAPKGYRLIGTDADGIQMRIFAHYVNDGKLTDALIRGKKSDRTDIHSVHQFALGPACKGRNPAKTFIYAWLLGAGIGKVAQILECSNEQAREAIDAFIRFYPGLAELKGTQIPRDANRGYFTGLDNRRIMCDNAHKMLGGYLQSGEAIIMKRACIQWNEQLEKEDKILAKYVNSAQFMNAPIQFINFVHDEWQTLVPDEDDIANYVANIQQQSIVDQGSQLQLNCPLGANSKFGYSWMDTH